MRIAFVMAMLFLSGEWFLGAILLWKLLDD